MARRGWITLKGGTGKTTSTVSTAAALVNKGKKVLIIDLDQQASATRYLDLDLGCPNRPLALDQFLDSQCHSRLSRAWWHGIVNEKGVMQACQLRPIGIFTTS